MLDSEFVSDELENAVRAVLMNLDNLQPFTTQHFNIFPYKSRWERVSELRFKKGDMKLSAYPFLLTLYVETTEPVPQHTANHANERIPPDRESILDSPHFPPIPLSEPKYRTTEQAQEGALSQVNYHNMAESHRPAYFQEPPYLADGGEGMVCGKEATDSMAKQVTPDMLVLLLPILLLMLLIPFSWSSEGLSPGCHLYPFNVTIRSDRRGTCRGAHVVYACVGYCESSAFPSRYSVLLASNFTHNITSASRCCTISKVAKVKVRVECPRGRHHDDIEILTAQACRCDMCRKSRY
ncbi:uncharacterized protein LOC108434596 [Pygocentrus nattereri]|nr:uncharacterized protein LOC108434596 [Pygocentrus nattereri]